VGGVVVVVVVEGVVDGGTAAIGDAAAGSAGDGLARRIKVVAGAGRSVVAAVVGGGVSGLEADSRAGAVAGGSILTEGMGIGGGLEIRVVSTATPPASTTGTTSNQS
jgi:hypothetical protein